MNVNLIQLDVTVRVTVTSRGVTRVTDLTASDFEISRNGKRQVLKSVIWVPGQRVGLAATASSLVAPGQGQRRNCRLLCFE